MRIELFILLQQPIHLINYEIVTQILRKKQDDIQIFMLKWRLKLTVFIIISFKYNPGEDQIQQIMAKKSKKSISRKSIAQRTIEQGREYVEQASRIRSKRLVRATRTMRQIVRVHADGLRTKPKKQYNSGSKTTQDKNKLIRKSAKTTKKSIKPIKRTASKSAKSSAVPVVPPLPTLIPLHPPATTTLVSSVSRPSNADKVAQLNKSKSKDLQIPAFGFIDVCFCVDSTGSMSSQLAQVQQVIKAIITNIESKVQTEGLQMRFAIVAYRDHPPQDSSYVTQHLDFTDQFEAINYVKTLTAGGGGDQPEAAHDGLLLSAQKLNWVQTEGVPTLRYIFHVADAPPHGKEFLNPQGQAGCLCGLQTDDVIREINKKSIHYRLIKARSNPKLDEMQKIFKQKVGDFDSTDIGHARELNVKVSDMIIHEVLPDYA